MKYNKLHNKDRGLHEKKNNIAYWKRHGEE